MPKKLKSYITSIGFFDLAVAAPSMKAALEAWGVKHNLFTQGFAKQTDEPVIVRATMERPGIVLKRAVGSRGAFGENNWPPKSLPAEIATARPRDAKKPKANKRNSSKAKVSAKIISLVEAKEARKAAADFEKEHERQEREREKQAAALKRKNEKRERAAEMAAAALSEAKERHEKVLRNIETQRDALDQETSTERARWKTEKERLEAALRRAQN